jgi:hypothetical protein
MFDFQQLLADILQVFMKYVSQMGMGSSANMPIGSGTLVGTNNNSIGGAPLALNGSAANTGGRQPQVSVTGNSSGGNSTVTVNGQPVNLSNGGVLSTGSSNSNPLAGRSTQTGSLGGNTRSLGSPIAASIQSSGPNGNVGTLPTTSSSATSNPLINTAGSSRAPQRPLASTPTTNTSTKPTQTGSLASSPTATTPNSTQPKNGLITSTPSVNKTPTPASNPTTPTSVANSNPILALANQSPNTATGTPNTGSRNLSYIMSDPLDPAYVAQSNMSTPTYDSTHTLIPAA